MLGVEDLTDYPLHMDRERLQTLCRELLGRASKPALRSAAMYALSEVISEGGNAQDETRLAEAKALRDQARAVAPNSRGAARAAYRELERPFFREFNAWIQEGEQGSGPLATYYPRLLKLLDGGAGRAGYLVVQVFDDLPFSAREERSKHAFAVVERLVEEHAHELWVANVCSDLETLMRYLGAEPVESLARRLIASSRFDRVASWAMYHLALGLAKEAEIKGDVRMRARAIALLEGIRDHSPNTPDGENAKGALFALTGLRVGHRAPDFVSEDVEGVELRLSDYRGKVVLLDFWGFW